MRLLRRFISLAILLIMGLFIINNTLFVHIHILDDGTQIVHAHPFKKAITDKPVPHKHTKQELLYLDNLSVEFILLLLSFVFIASSFEIRKSLSVSDLYLAKLGLLPTGRAPPFAHAML